MRQFLTLILFFFLFTNGFGQGDNTTVFFHIDKQSFKYKVGPTQSISRIKTKLLTQLFLEGYTGLNIQDSSFIKKHWHYRLSYTSHFETVQLISHNNGIETGIQQTLPLIDKWLNTLENNGYPFAQIMIDSVNAQHDQLLVTYHIDSGQCYTLSKIHLKSNSEFNEKTMLNILNLTLGELYNEAKIKSLSATIESNGAYRLLRPPALLFKPESAELFIYFEKRQTSAADGFIGFQQNAISRKLELNGNINLLLNNALNRSELIAFNWKSNPDKSQNLSINFDYPYLINLPLGITTKGTIQKQDTSFLRNSFYGGLQYLAPLYSTGFFVQRDNSFLLNETSSTNFKPFNKTIYGLETNIKYLQLQRYKPQLNIKLGLFNFQSDSLESETSIANLIIETSLKQEYQLSKTFKLSSILSFKQLNADYTISNNERFYFGGLKSVRGFYELELNGNTVFYALNSLEFKPVNLLSFQLIYDYAQFHANGFYRTNSFGFGFNLKNDNNALSFIIANGLINDSPLDLRNTKLHIGLVSTF